MKWLLLLALLLAACAPQAEPAASLPPADPSQPRLLGLNEAGRWLRGETSLFFEAGGAGRPVLLLHDLEPGADSFTAWRRNTVALLEAGYRVVALDLYGFGRSDLPAARLEPERQLELLLAFLHDGFDEPVIVVAAGRSAPYAIYLAAEHPERVAALALVGPSGYGAVPTAAEAQEAYETLARGGGLFRPDPFAARSSREGLLRHLREVVYLDASHITTDLLAAYQANLARPNANLSFYSVQSGSLSLAVADTWPRTTQPALIVWGEDNRVVPPAQAEAFLLARPDAELRLIANARTAVADERGLSFNAFLIEFLLRTVPPEEG